MTTPTAPVRVFAGNGDAWDRLYNAIEHPETVEGWNIMDCIDILYGCSDLGTRCIISGGEVVEIDSRVDPEDLDAADDLGGMC